ncbi:MAG: adenylate kinase [Parcubacteria group bacterium Athens1014_10]|nr:MAG: adenylate kinase [Parcubacteria group bacterium Athens1014_10]TSD05479.1 MAG: adenylate kinase [Parcubacteria group bacterium Athens0714_12]
MKGLNIIILGPQGSGKGTQARLLAEKFNLEHFEIGDMLREIAAGSSEFSKKVDKTINQQGKLVPYAWIIKMLKLRVQSLSANQGIIFDGSPRRLPEAKNLEKMLNNLGRKIDYVFIVNINEKESLKRLAIRMTCNACNQPFIIGKNVKKGQKKCPLCRGPLYVRKDDTPERIVMRLNIYKKETLPVINYFKKKKQLIEINGEQSVEKVKEDILKNIKN